MATLREVQLTQLEIAKEVKRLCDKHNITYFLDSGSLLGAIRHNGFIPWDDDLDMAFLREDYDKFLEVAKSELDDRYVLQTWENDRYYPHPFAKIRKKGTLFVETVSGSKQQYNGVFVDLFPYDVMPEEKKQVKQLGIKITLYKSLLRIKCGYKPWKVQRGDNSKRIRFLLSYIKYMPLRIVALFFSKNRLVKNYDFWSRKYNGDIKQCISFYEQAGTRFGVWVLPKECFENFEYHKFEDTEFLCPSKSHLYLSLMYGDYMQLPPENKRGDWHKIIQVEL